MIFNEICEIIYNKKIAKNIFEAKLSSDKISKSTKSGQFINILPSINFENAMRRPMSISYQDSESINIIYKSIGDGTNDETKRSLVWTLNLSDGKNSLLDISNKSGIKFELIKKSAGLLVDKNLIKQI